MYRYVAGGASKPVRSLSTTIRSFIRPGSLTKRFLTSFSNRSALWTAFSSGSSKWSASIFRYVSYLRSFSVRPSPVSSPLVSPTPGL